MATPHVIQFNLPSSEQPSTPAESALRNGRIQQLDVLRGLAIVLVLVAHTELFLAPGQVAPLGFDFLSRFGWAGVDLFFVLSGYLIGRLLFQEIRETKQLSIGRFLSRRAWKIWPPYFALIAFYVCREHYVGMNWAEIAEAYWPNLLQVQNYRLTPAALTWSLAVEEHFYCLLPIVLWMYLRSSAMSSLPIGGLAILGAVLVYRSLLTIWWPHPYSLQRDYTPTHLRIDSLLFGVLLSYAATFHQARFLAFAHRWHRSLALGGLTLISPMFILSQSDRFVYTVGYTLLYLGFGMLMLAMLSVTPSHSGLLASAVRSGPSKLLASIGQYSYSIYLWHFQLGIFPVTSNRFNRFVSEYTLTGQFFIRSIAFLLFAIGAGVVMYFVIERPTLAVRNWVTPRRPVQATIL